MPEEKHSGLPVSGYRPQNDENVRVVNTNKELEERVLRQIDAILRAAPQNEWDPRWAAVAKTHIEQGFMALNRAIFRPERIKLPGE